jgi:hypothetical protein
MTKHSIQIPSNFCKNGLEYFLADFDRKSHLVKYFYKKTLIRWFDDIHNARVFEKTGKETNSSQSPTDVHIHQACCELFGAGECDLNEWIDLSK